VKKILTKYLKKFHDKGVRIVILGTRERLTESVIKAIDEAEAKTVNNTNGTLALCFNYGGGQEIVDMIRSFIESGDDASTLTPQNLAKYMYHPEVPPCDLIVRTSGENRISGFMLPRSDYAEFIFDTTFWPDISDVHVAGYIEEFATRQRRYGK
jgi:undecaprenyl diphosphate synthase